MNVSGFKGTEAVNANYNNADAKKEVKQENVKPNTAGYAQKEEAPTNANLYKAMYGVNNKPAKTEEELQAEYVAKLAEVRAKYEMDVNDKNREKEYNRLEEQNPKKPEEKSYYEQYLEYKHKYE